MPKPEAPEPTPAPTPDAPPAEPTEPTFAEAYNAALEAKNAPPAAELAPAEPQPQDPPAPEDPPPPADPVDEPPWKARMREKRERQAAQAQREKEALEANRELIQEVTELKRQIAAFQQPAPSDPYQAAVEAAKRGGLSPRDLLEQLTKETLAADDPAAQALARAQAAEQQVADLQKKLEEGEKKKQEAEHAKQLETLITQDVELVVDKLLPAQKQHLPWLDHASPRALRQKARELIEYAAYHAEPGRYGADDVIDALNEYFSEVYSNVRAITPAPAATPPAQRPQTTPLGNRAAADVSGAPTTDEEREALSRELFARALSRPS